MSGPSVVEDVFLAALEKGAPEERAAFLNAACKDDPDLRRRVERLLEAHPKAGGFLEGPARPDGEQTAAYAPTGEQVGTVIAGRYKLLEQIGEGGMGTVWVAEQTQPVRRKVALKLIKPGMDSKTVLSRFEAERQALALMDHPNIAKVLDGGTTETGRPFFVMEYVKGIPFTKYCDDTRLSIAERLALFVPVCQAVQHAHQKGVIHRDLKPSNILVCLYDGKPVPKVIDFGLAKAIHQPLADHTLHTAHGAMMGTPLYMSPEQAEFNNFDVDTRTDVYALGVILYELLTGTTPLEKQRFQEAAWLEMLRLIKEEEPQRPSIRLSGSGSLPSLAAQRQLEPIKLTKLVRGELDWIVMKCLEKDRSRRYETANGLARDIEHYLADELVEARPPTAGYRLRKFARKHRAMLTTAAAFALLLIAAACVSSWLAVKANRAEASAEVRRHEAEANAKEAKENLEWSQANERALGETYNELEKVNVTNLIHILGLQVDLNLAEVRTDPRIGLLRLAHPLKDTWEIKMYGPNSIGEGHAKIDSNYPPFLELREFVTAAVLAAGQNYAPLLPPITHDGQAVGVASLSPDNRTLLTLGKDYTARLWDTRTGRLIAVLRKGDERVVNCGFSPDGRTVFTDDQTSVARFWDVPSGRFHTATEARQNRYAVSDDWLFPEMARASQIGAGRLLTRRFDGKQSHVNDSSKEQNSRWTKWEGPVELWDTATGRLVARLDAPGRNVETFQLMNGGRWIATIEGKSTVVVFSSERGKEIARLDHKTKEVVKVFASPTGRRIATVFGPRTQQQIRIWNTDTWKADSVTISDLAEYGNQEFVTDDVITSEYEWSVNIMRCGQEDPIDYFVNGPVKGSGLLDLAYTGDGRIYDGKTWQKKRPPQGRKYHPDLAKFAEGGRFVPAESDGVNVLIDTLTEKHFPTGDSKYEPVLSPFSNVPGFGLVATVKKYGSNVRGFGAEIYGVDMRLIPTSHLDLPPALLELWAQVAVRGELGAEGEFVKWDEPTWERKRQALAAVPAPHPELPFPGYVATDKLHWLRLEYENASDADKPDLAKQLLDRAEAAGDKAEAVRWRAILMPKPSPRKPAAKP